MPWVNEDLCVGCGVCVDDCPVNAISMEDEKAKINMEECIHCGTCHSACPQDAVRHDSEKIPEIVKENVKETEKFMQACAKYLGDVKEKGKCLKRMQNHFKKKKIIAEKTLEELKNIEKIQP